MPDPDRAGTAGKKHDPPNKRFWEATYEFLTGQELERASEGNKPELPGLFAFVRAHWKSGQPKEGPQEGFFRRYRRLNAEYQEAKFREVGNLRTYESIAQAARLSKEFLALLFSACIIATIGLFQSSTATIIGAMLIAPLMMPILGFALGTIWGDVRLVNRSLATLAIGTFLVLIVSGLLAAIVPGVEITPEIEARTNPNLFDILVALGSGLVGAYAFVNPRISPSIAGVAIAVALMPPLCTIGIGLGIGDSRVAMGALLLYSSNLVGIALAASFVFWRLRVHPALATKEEVGTRAKRNVVATTVLLACIAIPLAYFMHDSLTTRRLDHQVRTALFESFGDPEILSIDVARSEGNTRVRSVVVLPATAGKASVDEATDRVAALLPPESDVNLVVLQASSTSALVVEAPVEESTDRRARGDGGR